MMTGATAPTSPARDQGLSERLAWLVRLRWIAVLGVLLTVFLVKHVFSLPVQTIPLYTIAAFLAAYNLLFSRAVQRLKKKDVTGDSHRAANRIANAQISLDLLCLALLIFYSGGIENPFLFYFIFHMIIASILLSRRAAYLQASFAVLLFFAVTGLEYLEMLPHHCLSQSLHPHLYSNAVYFGGVSFVFVSTLYIAVYMATSISSRLREREQSLQRLNALLEEKDRIKSEYVLAVTHDIKGHLSAIQSCIEPVTMGLTGPLGQSQMDLLGRAGKRAERLRFFVDMLLEITRIRLSKGIKMQEFVLRQVVDSVVAKMRPRAEAKAIRFDSCVVLSERSFVGMPAYIANVLENLLDNAFKYTPQGGQVELRVQEHNEGVQIQVTDTGIGIPAGELSQIFEEFYRASNARHLEPESLGLGLSLTKAIVELHRGTIQVDSEVGKGASFVVQLPF